MTKAEISAELWAIRDYMEAKDIHHGCGQISDLIKKLGNDIEKGEVLAQAYNLEAIPELVKVCEVAKRQLADVSDSAGTKEMICRLESTLNKLKVKE
jgi:hypothetical protein